MPLALRRKLITAAYAVGSTLVLYVMWAITRSEVISVIALINLVLTFKIVRIGRMLQKMLIPNAVCRRCGTAVDLTGIWSCQCGYTSADERHIFDECPRCGRKTGFFDCPKCQVSIDVG